MYSRWQKNCVIFFGWPYSTLTEDYWKDSYFSRLLEDIRKSNKLYVLVTGDSLNTLPLDDNILNSVTFFLYFSRFLIKPLIIRLGVHYNTQYIIMLSNYFLCIFGLLTLANNFSEQFRMLQAFYLNYYTP